MRVTEKVETVKVVVICDDCGRQCQDSYLSKGRGEFETDLCPACAEQSGWID